MGLDVLAHLDRIGATSAHTADLPTLRRIIEAHTRSIVFENLDPLTGREVRLGPGALMEKLVRGGRGGWCYEQNTLLRGALDALGYRTTGLIARVLWGRADHEPLPPPSHMLLRVDLTEGPHVVDAGFGNMTLTGVLALEPEVEQATPHEPFRLWPDGSDFLMQARIGDDWRTLYRFDRTEQQPADYEVMCWYRSRHPASPFLAGVIAARQDVERRYALATATYSVHHVGGPTERRTLGTPALCRVLEEDFLIDLSGLPGLDATLSRLF